MADWTATVTEDGRRPAPAGGIARRKRRAAPGLGARLSRLLDATVPLGRQFGEPIEVTVRQIVRQTPCFLTIAALVGFVVFW